eukprot:TRINITY_DN3200_c0_g1_i1.p1 TRINITY_DN3200_c0_g1~~TRINITY_DN3200_c0_g1_i1.p1  ORF type:complete len:380 (-),score=159.48 TRINITY_DN3200_c0_g1_i1:20-1159(-)
MTQLSPPKKMKKEKKKRKNSESVDNSQLENSVLDTSNIPADAEVSLNNSPKKKKKKDKIENEEKINAGVTNGKVSGQTNKKTNSNVRNVKQRMLDDYKYIEGLMRMVGVRKHHLDDADDDDEDDLVDDVPEHLKFKMRQENEAGRAQSHEELRERLRKKMEELRGNNLSTNEERRKKRLKAKMRKLEKKNENASELKQKLMKVGKNAGNLNKIKLESGDTGVESKRPAVQDGADKVVFSKFDFVSDEVTPEFGKKKNLDPAAALAKISKNKEKLKEMQEKGLTDKVKRINDRVAWDTAIEKAEGTKVKDDVDLLKKALKRKEQKKKSSKKKWEERTENVEKKKAAFQTKRKDNLQKRKKDVKDGKKKMAIKKGRLIPGV